MLQTMLVWPSGYGRCCVRSNSAGMGKRTPGLCELSQPMKLLPSLMIGLCRLGRISVFEKMGGGKIILSGLHDISVRVALGEVVGLLQEVIRRLNRRDFTFTLLVIELC